MANNFISLQGLYCGTGRLVSGSLTEKQTKGPKGEDLPADKQRFFFAVAVPKTDPNFNDLWGKIWNMAATHYAQNQIVLGEINQGLAARNFAWKIDDGDTQRIDKKTNQWVDRPDHQKGCWIFKFTTSYPIGCSDMNGRQIDPSGINLGDYVDVYFSTTPNGNNDDTAGIYLNPGAMILVGYGERIATGINPVAAFAGRNYQLPPGASATPTSAGAMPPPGASAPGQPPQQGGYPGAPAAQPPQGQPPQQGGYPGAPAAQPPQGQPPQQGGYPGAPAAQPPQGQPPQQGGYPGAPAAQPQQGGYPGAPAAGNPGHAHTGTQQSPQGVPASGGMPAGQQGISTASPTNPAVPGVAPHPGILHGPNG